MPRPRWWWFLAVAVALVLARAGLQLWADAPGHALRTDIHGLVRSAAALLGLGWAAQRCGGGWRLLAAGAAAWCSADVCWLLNELHPGRGWGTWADIAFALFYPLFLAGVLLLPRAPGRTGFDLRRLLELGVVVAGTAAALWALLVAPALARGMPDGWLLAVGYPLGDLLVLWAALDLAVLGRSAGDALTGRLLALAAGVLVVADGIYGAQTLAGTYQSGNALGILWTTALVLVGLAGARAASAPRGAPPLRPADGGALALVLGSVAVSAAWLVTLLPTSRERSIDELLLALALVLAGGRQVLAWRDNRTLAAALRAANADLRHRVAGSTAELAVADGRLRAAEEERRATEAKVRELQRLEGLGQLAGGVAHDFNNMLAGILGAAELLAQRLPPDAPGRHHLDTIEKASRRAADLTRKLLSFARRGNQAEIVFDAHDAIEAALALLERSIDRRIAVVRALHAPRSTLRGDPAEIQSALLNLGLNARDAMPGGGELRVATALVALPGPDGPPDQPLAPGVWLRLTVADTGSGIPPDVLPRIFEPFFTTKEIGKGTGLGLAAVHGTVLAHRGAIAVASTPGAGTTFTIWLPLADGRPPTPTPAVGVVTAASQVLIVDDEPDLRAVMAELLSARGCRVRTAADGSAALAAVAAERPDVVVLDLVMPRMSGADCFAALRQRHPELPIVICSGFARDTAVDRLLAQGYAAFLPKPYDVEQLLRALAECRSATG